MPDSPATRQPIPNAPGLPILNWRELEALVRLIAEEFSEKTIFIDRVFIPELPEFPEGYLKGEWALKLHSREKDWVLSFSVRPRKAYLSLKADRRARAAGWATHSAFDLAMSKYIRGGRILGIETAHRERVVLIWISAPQSLKPKSLEDSDLEKYGLVLSMIPATPEAFLVEKRRSMDAWPILSRSRVEKAHEAIEQTYTPPDGSRAPESAEIRTELLTSTEAFSQTVRAALQAEAFDLRKKLATKALKEQLKLTRKRIEQSRTQLEKSISEPDWKHFGDLVLANLHTLPELRERKLDQEKIFRHRELDDYVSGQKVEVPWDHSLSPQAQAQKFYQLGKRKQRRLSESQGRLEGFEETEKRLSQLQESLPHYPNWQALETLERAVGIETPNWSKANERESGKGRKASGRKPRTRSWLGRSFISKDGAPIWVGKTRDENLELTFKYAKGNDLWMHLRGKPGAHTVIPLQTGKSASLETLLDAAQLTLFYSGGENWGKTEVDYTYRKYVKRIKNSTEVSYTHNKTLLVQADQERLNRLLSKQ